jgi:uncharacterized membrane protein
MLKRLSHRTSPFTLPLCSAAAIFMTAITVPAQQPFFMGLGDLPGGPFISWATDVSHDGSVVTGWSVTDDVSSSNGDLFRWTRETGMVSLGAIHAYNFPEISADGSTIIGEADPPGGGCCNNDAYLFRWTQASGVVPLQFGGHAAIGGIGGVNRDGTIVVGWRNHSSLGRHEAVRWIESSGVELIFADLPSEVALDISADGSVILALETYASGSPRMFIAEPDGITFIEGTSQPGSHGELELSDNGSVVVGVDRPAETEPSAAFRWTKESGLHYLGNLPGGKRTASVRGLSADGSIIVGNSEPDPNNLIIPPGASGWAVAREPFIWDQTHGPRYLFEVLKNDYGLTNALQGWSHLGHVSGISGDGSTIVGLGINPNGNAEAWIAHLGPPTAQLPGDFNASRTVDAADYVVWRNRDGTLEEYQTWRAHFGQTATNLSGAADSVAPFKTHIPEPPSIVLFLVAIPAALTRLRQLTRNPDN